MIIAMERCAIGNADIGNGSIVSPIVGASIKGEPPLSLDYKYETNLASSVTLTHRLNKRDMKYMETDRRRNRANPHPHLEFLCKQGRLEEALSYLANQCSNRDYTSYAYMLRECSRAKNLSGGRKLHGLIVNNRLEGITYFGNLLVEMYNKCGTVESAREIFDKIQEKNIFSWTSIIAAYVENGKSDEAIRLFQDMHSDGIKVDMVAFLTILKACSLAEDISRGKMVHACLNKGICNSNVFLATSLVNMYGKCRNPVEAWTVFYNFKGKDVVLWNAMIATYGYNGNGKGALELFRQMIIDGLKPDNISFASTLDACGNLESIPDGVLLHAHAIKTKFDRDAVVASGLVYMYGQCGRLETASTIFDKINEWSLASWTGIIAACCRNDHFMEALSLFYKMGSDDFIPDKTLLFNVLDACSNSATLSDGKYIHALIIQTAIGVDVTIQTSLVNMYGKCKSLEDAYVVFDRVPKRDVILWTVLIAACAHVGDFRVALKLFHEMGMEGVSPDTITFHGIVDACASLAALEQGRIVHRHISNDTCKYDIHVGNALINMYQKCGSLKDAYQVFDNMVHRNVISYSSMILAYAQQGCGKQALTLFQKMQMKGVPPNSITLITMLSACTHARLSNEGCHHFVCMSSDFGVPIMAEHYGHMINLLGSAGHFNEAEDLIRIMPLKLDSIGWMTLVGACRVC